MPDILTLRAAKFWTGLAGVCLVAWSGEADAPAWVRAAAAALTAAAVYLVPNTPPDGA